LRIYFSDNVIQVIRIDEHFPKNLFYLNRRTKFNDPTSPMSMAVNVSRNGTDFHETTDEPWKNIEEGHSSVEKSEKCRMQTKKQFLLSTSIDDNRAL
jgi:hypothetical protein